MATKSENRISQQVIGILGGATQQAVSQSGNPVRWLQSRLREILVPNHKNLSDQIPGSLRVTALDRAKAHIYKIAAALQALPEAKAGGRPVSRSTKALAEMLGVEAKQDLPLLTVFNRYVKKLLDELEVHYGSGRYFWREFFQLLDKAWLPMYPKAEPCYPDDFAELLGG